MLEQGSIQRQVIVEWSELNAIPSLLNVANGTVDLRTGELREPSQDDLISKMIDVKYEPDARSDEWENFLLEKLPDEAVRNYVHELVGYSASGMPRQSPGCGVFRSRSALRAEPSLLVWRRIADDRAFHNRSRHVRIEPAVILLAAGLAPRSA